jgi:hypothetical protein
MKLIAAIGDQVSPTLSAFAFACQTLFACSGLNRMLLDRSMFTKVATREKSENQKKSYTFEVRPFTLRKHKKRNYCRERDENLRKTIEAEEIEAG